VISMEDGLRLSWKDRSRAVQELGVGEIDLTFWDLTIDCECTERTTNTT
jgi:hypothetical protein